MNGIQIKNLNKRFGKKEVIKNLNLTIEPGKIYGLLGRNGAGKSTLINLISKMLVPTSGTINIDNWDSQSKFSKQGLIYVQSDIELIDKSNKVKKVVKDCSLLNPYFNIETCKHYLNMFEINVNNAYGKLSTGQKSLFKICLALSMDVKYLILDEPILGLDAYNRDLFYKELLNYYEQTQTTIIISTHIIEEINNIIENVIILKQGKILVNENVQDLIEKAYVVSGEITKVDNFIKNKDVIFTQQIGNIKQVYLFTNSIEIDVDLDLKHIGLQEMFIKLSAKDLDYEKY